MPTTTNASDGAIARISSRSDLPSILLIQDAGLKRNDLYTLYHAGYDVTVLTNPTCQEIVDHVTRRHFDIIHFDVHSCIESTNSYLCLRDGEYLDISTLIQIVKTAHATLVYLNACSTISFAQQLVDAYVDYVIATMSQLDDMVASHTAQLFYTELAQLWRGSERVYRRAYLNSKPTKTGLYVLLIDGIDDDDLSSQVEQLQEQILSLNGDLKSLLALRPYLALAYGITFLVMIVWPFLVYALFFR